MAVALTATATATRRLVPECSGGLVSPRVFLTAGHCTNTALAAGGAYVVFGDEVKPGWPLRESLSSVS